MASTTSPDWPLGPQLKESGVKPISQMACGPSSNGLKRKSAVLATCPGFTFCLNFCALT